jgi:hypothetical protein
LNIPNRGRDLRQSVADRGHCCSGAGRNDMPADWGAFLNGGFAVYGGDVKIY